MLINTPHILYKRISTQEKSALLAGIFGGMRIIWSGLLFGLLPIILSLAYNEIWVGIIISSATFLSILIRPITAGIINKIWSIKTIILSNIFFIFTWVILVGLSCNIVPMNIGLILLVLCMFLWYGLNGLDTYILQSVWENNWGTIFGLVESILAIWTFISTLLIPRFEGKALWLVWIIIVITVLIGTIGVSFLKKPDIVRNIKKQKGTLNIFKNIREGIFFIKKNKYYPIIAILNGIFGDIFYSSIWFLVPFLIVQYPNHSLSWMSLGIYEIITIFFCWFLWWIADKYNRKKVYMIGRIGIIIWAILFCVQIVNPFLMLVIAWIFVGLWDNVIYGWWNYVLEKTNRFHEGDASFIAVKWITNNIWGVIMPIILWIIINQYSVYMGFVMMSSIVILLWIISMFYVNRFKRVIK